MIKSELERKYNVSRYNILLLIILSIVNIITILYNNSYFLFSLSFPRFLQMVIEGLIEEGSILRSNVNYFMVAIIMVIPIVLFLLCYIFTSNNRYKGFIFAILLLILDSVFTIITLDYIDIFFHIYILVLLALGINYGRKIKIMHNDELIFSLRTPILEEEGNDVETPDSPILRNDDLKGRVLISGIYQDLTIIVKRRFGLTELIINGKVYAEYKRKIETAYEIQANVNSINVTFRFQDSIMYLIINGAILTSKTRWF